MSRIKDLMETLRVQLLDNGIDCKRASVEEIEAGLALFTDLLTAKEISEMAKALHDYYNLDLDDEDE